MIFTMDFVKILFLVVFISAVTQQAGFYSTGIVAKHDFEKALILNTDLLLVLFL